MSGPEKQSPLLSSPPLGRLIVSGSILVDLMLKVDALPEPGGDILTHGSEFTVAGGFNVLVCAHRQGMRTAYAGRIGTGPLGAMVVAALSDVDAEILIAPVDDGDTGFCVVMVDAGAERTMLTTIGVEAGLQADELNALRINDNDTVYVSGYDLAYPHGPLLGAWLERISPQTNMIFDPGPLVAQIPANLLDAVLRRATWLSLNAAESQAISGERDHARAADGILRSSSGMKGVVVRDGARGCLLKVRDGECVQVPGFATEALDTTGAGDCHVGAFAALLASGRSPQLACVWANAAAAIAVSRWGPATGPSFAETAALLEQRS